MIYFTSQSRTPLECSTTIRHKEHNLAVILSVYLCDPFEMPELINEFVGAAR